MMNLRKYMVGIGFFGLCAVSLSIQAAAVAAPIDLARVDDLNLTEQEAEEMYTKLAPWAVEQGLDTEVAEVEGADAFEVPDYLDPAILESPEFLALPEEEQERIAEEMFQLFNQWVSESEDPDIVAAYEEADEEFFPYEEDLEEKTDELMLIPMDEPEMPELGDAPMPQPLKPVEEIVKPSERSLRLDAILAGLQEGPSDEQENLNEPEISRAPIRSSTSDALIASDVPKAMLEKADVSSKLSGTELISDEPLISSLKKSLVPPVSEPVVTPEEPAYTSTLVIGTAEKPQQKEKDPFAESALFQDDASLVVSEQKVPDRAVMSESRSRSRSTPARGARDRSGADARGDRAARVRAALPQESRALGIRGPVHRSTVKRDAPSGEDRMRGYRRRSDVATTVSSRSVIDRTQDLLQRERAPLRKAPSLQERDQMLEERQDAAELSGDSEQQVLEAPMSTSQRFFSR